MAELDITPLTVSACEFCGEPTWPYPHYFYVPVESGEFRICIRAVVRRLASMPEWQDIIEFTPKEKP